MKTHCPQGHSYDDRNTVVARDGRRRCRRCRNDKRLRYEARKRDERDPVFLAKRNELAKASYERLRRQVIAAYGSCCACCGEARYEFLQIDHVHNDGAEHRRQLKNSAAVLRAIRDAGYPPEYQALCANCNFAKARDKQHVCKDWKKNPESGKADG